MRFSDPSKSLQEILEPFAGSEQDPFDTPEAIAATERVAELSRAMAQTLAERRAAVQVNEILG